MRERKVFGDILVWKKLNGVKTKKNQIGKQIKNSFFFYKNPFLTKLKKRILVKTTWLLDNQWYVLRGPFWDLLMFFLLAIYIFTDCENTGRPKYIGFINRFHPQKQTFLQIHTDSETAQKVKGLSNITFTVLGSKRSETTHDKLAGDVSFCSHSELNGATCGVSPASWSTS